MLDWIAVASALSTAAGTVGGELVKAGLSTSLKPASEQFNGTFLRGYQAKQHENDLRRALQATEEQFRKSPGVTSAQADAVLTRVTKLATDKNLQKQTLAALLTLDDPSPARISDDLLRAFGLNSAERAAFANFLHNLRLQFAAIEGYKPLVEFAHQEAMRQYLSQILGAEWRTVEELGKIYDRLGEMLETQKTKSRDPEDASRVYELKRRGLLSYTLPRRTPFFGREQEIACVLNALEPEERVWGVEISGIGGIGKTALAIEVAYICLERGLFQDCLFVTGKTTNLEAGGERPVFDAAPNLQAMLGSFIDVLSVKGIMYDPKWDKHKNMLHTLGHISNPDNRILVIVDNLEILSPEELNQISELLRRLPFHCKGIATTRKKFLEGAVYVILEKLEWGAAKELILNEMRYSPQLAATLSAVGEMRWQELYDAVEGRPLALQWMLGRIRRKAISFDSALEYIRKQRTSDSPLYEFMYREAKQEMVHSDWLVLGALASVDRRATLEDLVEVTGLTRWATESAVERLYALSLIRIHGPDGPYSLDSLTRRMASEEIDAHPEIAKILTRLVTSDQAQALNDYLAHVREKLAYLSFLFVRPRSREATTESELEAVFVPLQVHDPEAEEKMRRRVDKNLPGLQDLEGFKPQTINDILPRYDYILLNGAPGSGKTTLLRHLALAFANGEVKEKLDWQGDPLLPILVPLRNFGEFLRNHRKEFPAPAPMSLLTYIQDHFTKNALALTPDFFRQRLENGKCLVLLDALDEEIDVELRILVAQHITSFIDRYRPRKNRFVLSSRPKGYDEVAEYLPRPIICTIQPLASDGRAKLVRNLCRALERDPARAEKDAAELLAEIPRKDRVDELSRNPLFCTTIVLVSKYRGATLPERRVDIFKEIVDLLLGFWDTSRYDVAEAFQLATDDGTGRAFRDVGEAVEAKHRALAHLAYWMQQQGRAETPEQDALAQLETFFRDREGEKNVPDKWARGFLVIAHQRSGLFIEGAPNLYNFSHSNFREYLAATELVKEPDRAFVQKVLEHIGEAWWEETILLAMALKELGDPRRKLLMDEMLQRGHLLMAGKAAVDMSDRLAAPLRDEIVTKLRTLMQSIQTPLKDRAAAGEILDALGWLPDDLDAFVFVPGAGNRRGLVELNGSEKLGGFGVGTDPTDPSNSTNPRLLGEREFWIAKYPVTCSQYQRFIDAGGYENEKYWRDQRGVDEKGRAKSIGDEASKWLQQAGGAERRPRYWDNPRFHRAGYPVIGVTWYEASAYCAWLAEQGRRQKDEGGNFILHPSSFRLPTEAEWVRAAGGEENERYAWDKPGESTGKLPDEKRKEIVLARANVKENELGGTTPVAMYPDGVRVTEKGDKIWDLAGNVWEWTSTIDKDDWTWTRGGSWYQDISWSRVSARYSWTRHGTHDHGFRVFAQ